MKKTTKLSPLLVFLVVAVILFGCIWFAMDRRARQDESFISRKSSLYDAGVTLQLPHIRALGASGWG